MEIWKDVPNTNGIYQVSNYGNFKSFKSGEWKTIKPFEGKLGYRFIDFMDRCKRDRWKVHRIIATIFIDNPNDYKMVNHIDGDKHNNHADNLEWCTASHNIKHAYDTGLKPKLTGERHGRSKLTQLQANEIKTECISGKLTQVEVGKKFGVSRAAVQRILYGIAWSE